MQGPALPVEEQRPEREEGPSQVVGVPRRTPRRGAHPGPLGAIVAEGEG